MAPRSKDAASAPTITTHHSMAAGGRPSAAHEPGETPEATTGEGAEVVLTRPKKLVLQPMHTAATPSDDESVDQAPKPALDSTRTEKPDDDAPLVLETAAETEAAANKLAAKLPEDKIELPLSEVALEDIPEDELDQPVERSEAAPVPEIAAVDAAALDSVKDPGESTGAAAEVDPNDARAQKAEALVVSGKYTVRIHESSRSRTGLFIAIMTGVLAILAAAYFAAAEDMLDVGVDLPKFW